MWSRLTQSQTVSANRPLRIAIHNRMHTLVTHFRSVYSEMHAFMTRSQNVLFRITFSFSSILIEDSIKTPFKKLLYNLHLCFWWITLILCILIELVKLFNVIGIPPISGYVTSLRHNNLLDWSWRHSFIKAKIKQRKTCNKLRLK